MGRGGGAHRSMKSLNAGDSSVRDSGHRLGRLPASFDSSSDMCVGAAYCERQKFEFGLK